MSVSNRRLDKVTEDTSGEKEGEGEKEPLDLEMTRRRMRAYNTLTVAESEVDLRKAAAESEGPVHQVIQSYPVQSFSPCETAQRIFC